MEDFNRRLQSLPFELQSRILTYIPQIPQSRVHLRVITHGDTPDSWTNLLLGGDHMVQTIKKQYAMRVEVGDLWSAIPEDSLIEAMRKCRMPYHGEHSPRRPRTYPERILRLFWGLFYNKSTVGELNCTITSPRLFSLYHRPHHRTFCYAATTILEACEAMKRDHPSRFDTATEKVSCVIESLRDFISELGPRFMPKLERKASFVRNYIPRPDVPEAKTMYDEDLGKQGLYGFNLREDKTRKSMFDAIHELEAITKRLREALAQCGLVKEETTTLEDGSTRHERIVVRGGLLTEHDDVHKALSTLDEAAKELKGTVARDGRKLLRDFPKHILPSRFPAQWASAIPEVRELQDLTSNPANGIVFQYAGPRPKALDPAVLVMVQPRSPFRSECLSVFGPSLSLDFGDHPSAILAFSRSVSEAAKKLVTNVHFQFDAKLNLIQPNSFISTINEAFPALETLMTSVWPAKMKKECNNVEERWDWPQREYLNALHDVEANVLLHWRWLEDAQWFDRNYGGLDTWEINEFKMGSDENFGKFVYARTKTRKNLGVSQDDEVQCPI